MRRALAAIALAASLGASAAAAATSITKHRTASVTIPAGATRTLNVPYPDALKYGNARYSDSIRVLRKRGSRGSAPDVGRIGILEGQAVEGGSLYRVRAHNANPPGSAPVELTVTTTTVEPLPHS